MIFALFAKYLCDLQRLNRILNAKDAKYERKGRKELYSPA